MCIGLEIRTGLRTVSMSDVIRLVEYRTRRDGSELPAVTLAEGTIVEAAVAQAVRREKREAQGFTYDFERETVQGPDEFTAITGRNAAGDLSRLALEVVAPSPASPAGVPSSHVDPFAAIPDARSEYAAEKRTNGNIAEAAAAGDKRQRAKRGIGPARTTPPITGYQAQPELSDDDSDIAAWEGAVQQGGAAFLAKEPQPVSARTGKPLPVPQDVASRLQRYGYRPESQESGRQAQEGGIRTIQGLTAGTYTVIEGSGDYRTLKVSDNDDPEFFKGEGFKLGYLSGPDNDADYTGFGLLKPDGSIVFWKRFRGTETETSLRRAMAILLQDPLTAGEAYAVASKRCFRCNRTLTVPASLHRGLGPDCAAKLGF